MNGEIHIGTSGWNYEHWSGRFYPNDLDQKAWFAFYAKRFSTVEINNTFYHQPEADTFEKWKEQAPLGFQYAVKANRYLTHLRKLSNPQEPLETFLGGVRHLGSHLGPILYQLPPNWKPNLDRLRNFLEILPADYRHAIEFRNRDWLTEKTYSLLTEHGVALCVHDMLKRHPRRITGPFVYIRFHGTGKKYGGTYRPSRLQPWADWIDEVGQEHDVFAYFNNDENAYAVRDAQKLQELTQTDH